MRAFLSLLIVFFSSLNISLIVLHGELFGLGVGFILPSNASWHIEDMGRVFWSYIKFICKSEHFSQRCFVCSYVNSETQLYLQYKK